MLMCSAQSELLDTKEASRLPPGTGQPSQFWKAAVGKLCRLHVAAPPHFAWCIVLQTPLPLQGRAAAVTGMGSPPTWCNIDTSSQTNLQLHSLQKSCHFTNPIYKPLSGTKMAFMTSPQAASARLMQRACLHLQAQVHLCPQDKFKGKLH